MSPHQRSLSIGEFLPTLLPTDNMENPRLLLPYPISGWREGGGGGGGEWASTNRTNMLYPPTCLSLSVFYFYPFGGISYANGPVSFRLFIFSKR